MIKREMFYVKRNPELIDRKVIEDIKCEIKRIRDNWELDCYHDEADALTLALKIIDKHISGKEQA